MPEALPHDSPHLLRSPEEAAAVLDPLRLRLLRHLEFPISASGLARRLRLPRQKVNYHLRELEKRGLVRLVRERRAGNCTERLVQAVARTFALSPTVLGPLAAEPRTEPVTTLRRAAHFPDDGSRAAFEADLTRELDRLLQQHATSPDADPTTIVITVHPPDAPGLRLPDPRPGG